MMRRRDERIVRREVRRYLLEYGQDYGPSLYSAFIQPFVDVIDTAKAGIETAASKVQLLTNVATYAIVTSIVPLITQEYEQMFELDKRRMDKIQSKYQEVFKRTDDALTTVDGNYDGGGIFFLLFPHKVITYNLAKAAGTSDIARMAGDTAFDVLDALTNDATGVVTDPLRKKLGMTEGARRLVEAEEGDAIIAGVRKVMNHPQVVDAVERSSTLRNMREDGVAELKNMLDGALEPIHKLKSAETLQDVEAVTGKAIDRSMFKDASDDEVHAVLEDVLPSVVKQAIDAFEGRIATLRNNLVTMAEKTGVKDDRTFVKLMRTFDEALTDANK